jgi:hypothetical protein
MKLQILAVLAFVVGAVPGFAEAGPCVPNLPSEGTELLASAYPGYRVLQLSDLNSDDQGIWTSAYGGACPGLVEGAFKGKKGAYAVLLVPINPGGETRAVVLEPNERGGMSQEQIFAENRAGNLPVIRRGDPGVYKDLEKRTKVTASNDVVLIEHLESKVTAIAFVRGTKRILTIFE